MNLYRVDKVFLLNLLSKVKSTYVVLPPPPKKKKNNNKKTKKKQKKQTNKKKQEQKQKNKTKKTNKMFPIWVMLTQLCERFIKKINFARL